MDDPFAHLFLVLTWNLMCRGENTQGVQLEHMSRFGDSIGIVLHTKVHSILTQPKFFHFITFLAMDSL